MVLRRWLLVFPAVVLLACTGGTDHAAAGPVFLLGRSVRGGLYGDPPDLSNLDRGDLRYSTDFRAVYAPVLE